MKRPIVRLVTLLLLLSVALAACDEPAAPPAPEESLSDPTPAPTPDGEVPEEEQEPLPEVDLTDAKVLAKDQTSEYVLVYDDGIDSGSLAQIRRFRTKFYQKTGVELKLFPDTEEVREKEILVGDVDGREGVSETLSALQVPGQNGYRIAFTGEKLVVACSDPTYLADALDLLLGAVRPLDGQSYGLPKDYVGALDIPTPICSWQAKIQWFYTGSAQYTVRVGGVSAKQYANYCAELEKTFRRYSESAIGDNRFATFVKDDESGRMAVYTMYYPLDNCYKITYGTLGYLPELEKQTADAVIPSVTQNGHIAYGACSIVQLGDGRFLIFDGATNNATDQETLYKLLQSMTPGGGKPVIACWFFTHAHSDHMGLAIKFMERYHADLDLQMVGHNFPDFNRVELVNEDPDTMQIYVNRLDEVLNAYYPNTKEWIVHTGEVIQFPNCELEILYTQADYATNPSLGAVGNNEISFPWGNHTCTTYRLVVNSTVYLNLGDSEKTLCKWMSDHYTTYMKSDILSLSHHGLNGGELSLYQYIDPDICFWPNFREAKESEKCTKYDFNKYLLNVDGYGTRDREHYCIDETVTILCRP